jgi:hypothetical protein
MPWLPLLRLLLRVLPKAVEEVREGAVRHEDRRELNGSVFGACCRAANSNHLNPSRPIFEGFELEIDIRRAFKLDVDAWLCAMYREFAGLAAGFSFVLHLNQGIVKHGYVVLSVRRTVIHARLNLPRVR